MFGRDFGYKFSVIITLPKIIYSVSFQTFRHVSLLQVLHKTNDPLVKEINLGGPRYKKENPIDLLTKGIY